MGMEMFTLFSIQVACLNNGMLIDSRIHHWGQFFFPFEEISSYIYMMK
jgi:hypothetical protein